MPNIMGGDQNHSGYNPDAPIGENEVLVKGNLYEIKMLDSGEVEVWVQGIEDKEPYICLDSLIPKEVREKIEQLKKAK